MYSSRYMNAAYVVIAETVIVAVIIITLIKFIVITLAPVAVRAASSVLVLDVLRV